MSKTAIECAQIVVRVLNRDFRDAAKGVFTEMGLKIETSPANEINQLLDDTINGKGPGATAFGRVGFNTSIDEKSLKQLNEAGVTEEELRETGFYGNRSDKHDHTLRMSLVVGQLMRQCP